MKSKLLNFIIFNITFVSSGTHAIETKNSLATHVHATPKIMIVAEGRTLETLFTPPPITHVVLTTGQGSITLKPNSRTINF